MSHTNEASAKDPWLPVPIVQLDLNAPASAHTLGVAHTPRVWVEAERDGHILGVLETSTHEEWPPGFLDALRARVDGIESQRHVVDDEQLPMVSVIVPTICVIPNQLVQTVESLLALDYPHFEILIVDNRAGEHPPLPDFSGNERVRCLSEEQRGISAARNKGVDSANGSIVAFTDDDVSVHPQWLRAIGNCFAQRPDVEAVGGLVLPRELDTAPQLWFEEFFGGFSKSFDANVTSVATMRGVDAIYPYAPGRFGAGCNMAFRRSTIERLGGFNVALGTGTLARGGEDLAMFLDVALAGGSLAFEPAALVRHSHRASERAFLKQVFGYGVGLTAMYGALIAQDPGQLAPLAKRGVFAIRELARPRQARSASRSTSFPKRCHALQLLGMAYGPLAYARSVFASRHV